MLRKERKNVKKAQVESFVWVFLAVALSFGALMYFGVLHIG
jgi:hypothetical protein